MAAPLTLSPPSSLEDARKRIFESVFPPSTASSLPTPLATPTASFAPPPHTPTPSHGYNTRHHPTPSSAADIAPSPVTLLPSPSAVLAKESRAWHLATSYLSFPNTTFPSSVKEWTFHHTHPPAPDVLEAIRYLILNNEDGNTDGRENLIEWYVCEVRRHYLGWVRPEIEIPATYDSPAEVLQRILQRLTTAQAIYLRQLKSYLLISHADVTPKKGSRRKGKKVATHDDPDEYDPRVRSFLRSLNSIISYTLPDPAWSQLVYAVMLELCGLAVGLSAGEEGQDDDATVMDDETTTIASNGSADDEAYNNLPQSFSTVTTDADGDIMVEDDEGNEVLAQDYDATSDFSNFKRTVGGSKAQVRQQVLELWGAMERIGVGGGGRRGERVFAEVVNTLITTYIQQSFAGAWASPSKVGHELDEWVENVLGKLIVDVLFPSRNVQGGDPRLEKLSPRESLRANRQSLDKALRGGMDVDTGAGADEEEQKRRREDLDSWKRMAVGRLGRMRVGELFDIVVEWPDSLGGVEDLKSYITNPQTRLHLTTTFTAAVASRLLHPAAATSDILHAYIRLIRAFTVLDPRGVLLDRVSRGIRRYLRDRDDTIRVIVRGIMSDSLISDESDHDELSELASELGKGIPALVAASGGLEDLDYDDMTWVPDPVDAGPEFRRSKGLDVVGSLLSLWDNKEVWIKEVQSVLSSRLLREANYDFVKEIRTVELLKLRFGEAAVQSCDVMLKDMADSKRADTVIRETQCLVEQDEETPELHAKILSRLFWPAVREETLTLPPAIQKLMEEYNAGFEDLKKKRKIDWMPTLGTVEVELELEDRVLCVPDATPSQAAVIYAFDEEESSSPVTRSVDELKAKLEMRESAVKDALAFWVGKEVLYEVEADRFAILERAEDGPDAVAAGQAAGSSGGEAEEDLISEERKMERTIVRQYVVGMLTNGGSMATERIAMMLGMVVPGGLSWSTEELESYLKEMEKDGVIRWSGADGWAVV